MSLKRNASSVLKQLVETKTNQLLTRVPCKIQVPARFMDVGLGSIGIETFILGCFPLILESGEYSVCNVNALLQISPYKTLTATIDDVPYYEFYFNAGDIVITTTELVKKDTLMYNIFDEFIFKGKIPWYLEYEDIGHLFDSAKYHGASNIAQTLEIIELLASIITRSRSDRSKQIRLLAESYADTTRDHIDYVALKSIYYSISSTVNKLGGSYFSEGVTSALVQPSDRVDKIESILRT